MSRQSATGSQHGAILIHVAFALLAHLAFTAFVLDHGVMLASRRPAQNANGGAATAPHAALRRRPPGRCARRAP